MAHLEGTLVLDLTRNLAGPFCTMTLGDLGAEVVKVEQPGAGDDTRHWAPPTWGDVSATFLSANRNKRSVAVDLSTPDGVEVVRALARRADVLVESFKPGSLDKRGLGWEQLREENPQLVYCSISAYGSDGPMRDAPGYDPVVQAYSGIMHLTGWPDGPPARLGIAALDLGSALWATIGIQAALASRAVTGVGSRVETSLLETAAWWLSYHLGGFLGSGVEPQRAGTSTGFIAPYETFPTADGDLMVTAGNDNLFRAFTRRIGLDDDPRFASNALRVANRQALRDRVVVALSKRTAREWADVLGSSVPCTPVRSVGELAADPQLEALGLVQPLPVDGVDGFRAVGQPFQVDGQRSVRWDPPPALGEHTDAVLAELGYSADDVARLRADGVVA